MVYLLFVFGSPLYFSFRLSFFLLLVVTLLDVSKSCVIELVVISSRVVGCFSFGIDIFRTAKISIGGGQE